MLLLWIIYVISVLFCYAFIHVCLLMPCGHLLGKGWPLGSRLWCLIVTMSLSHWYPGPGVVLDWIDFWSLPSFLIWDGKGRGLTTHIHQYIDTGQFSHYSGNKGMDRVCLPLTRLSLYHIAHYTHRNYRVSKYLVCISWNRIWKFIPP